MVNEKFTQSETTFQLIILKKNRKLSINDKFGTNTTKKFSFCYSLIFLYEIKAKLLSENLLNESKNWYSTEKDEKATYRKHATSLFPIQGFLLFSVVNIFAESLYKDM